jgi:hypothetical protein
VKFFYIYKSLAHPELAGGYVQPFTLDERLAHARQAETQLGGKIAWLVDAMDNRLKHALGDRPNSEFIIDPNGKIVRKRAWSHPGQVRKDLEELVGPVEIVTREEDVKLNVQLPVPAAAERGVVPRLKRPRMQPLVMQPKIGKDDIFLAKLRPEADADLIQEGSGKLYLGFHLDPFHRAHWNNLTPPLSYKLDLAEGVKIAKATASAPKVDVASDADPREFLVEVESWPADKTIRLIVSYSACVADGCHALTQEYVLYRKRDKDGGGARGVGAGFWEKDQFARQLMAGDKNGDGKLAPDEVRGLVAPHFRHFDRNGDRLLDVDELKQISIWLNEHHAPGPGPLLKK